MEGESAPPRPPHSSIALAARLARFCTRFADRAELQLAGGALPEPDEMRWRWAAFVEEVGGGGGGDPLVVDVRTTVEGGRRVRVGLAGLARVRLRYPLPGESVLCEGIAFVVRDPRTAAPADAPRDAR